MLASLRGAASDTGTSIHGVRTGLGDKGLSQSLVGTPHPVQGVPGSLGRPGPSQLLPGCRYRSA